MKESASLKQKVIDLRNIGLWSWVMICFAIELEMMISIESCTPWLVLTLKNCQRNQ